MAPYRDACGWEKIRPTRIDPRDTTAPMPISASTPHFTQAVTSSAKPCIPGGAAGQTAAVVSDGAAAAGMAPHTTNPARASTTVKAPRAVAAAPLPPLVIRPAPPDRSGIGPPSAGAEAAATPPSPAARPATGRQPPPAS